MTVYKLGGCPRSVMVKVLDSRVVVREFELQSLYYVHFPPNAYWERYEPLYPPIYGLNSSPTVLLRKYGFDFEKSEEVDMPLNNKQGNE